MSVWDAAALVALIVRVYDGYGLTQDDLRTAREEAAAVLREAGIALTWIDCPAGEASPCADAVEPAEIVLRLAAPVEPIRGPVVPMGFSLVDRSNPLGGRLATVYPDRVMRTARSARTRAPQLMGRAIAHEIGHLLLNHSRHAGSGLMRANWSSDEIRRNRPSDWSFTLDEAVAMRARIQSRSAASVRPPRNADTTGG